MFVNMALRVHLETCLCVNVYVFIVNCLSVALPVDNPPPNTNTLPKLTDEQTVQLKAAKKYCLEATVRHVRIMAV